MSTKSNTRTRGLTDPRVAYAEPTDAQAAKGKVATVFVGGALRGYIVRLPSGAFRFELTAGRGVGEEFATLAAVKADLEGA